MTNYSNYREVWGIDNFTKDVNKNISNLKCSKCNNCNNCSKCNKCNKKYENVTKDKDFDYNPTKEQESSSKENKPITKQESSSKENKPITKQESNSKENKPITKQESSSKEENPTKKPKNSKDIEEFSLYKTTFYKSTMKFLCKYKYIFLHFLILIFLILSFYFAKKMLSKDDKGKDLTLAASTISAAAGEANITNGKYLIQMNNKYFILPKDKVIEIF